MPVYDTLLRKTGLKLAMYDDSYGSRFWYLEIFSDKASKESAVNYLRELYGYEQVIGFGDNLNDLPMFAACDIRVAVGNAKPEVKAAADYMCGSHSDDGVAQWLQKCCEMGWKLSGRRAANPLHKP
jgi:hydroxymethylpyrimidine pyrophosphatase-like HAD family hydrolase